MNRNIVPIPEGYHTLTPILTVRHAMRAIEFYKRAFGAEERFRMLTPDGKLVAHAELQIGSSRVMVTDEMNDHRSPAALGGSPVGFYMYVTDADEAFKRAVEAGGKAGMSVQNMFWGDRVGQIIDPYGHVWMLATHVEELTSEEISERAAKAFAQTAEK